MTLVRTLPKLGGTTVQSLGDLVCCLLTTYSVQWSVGVLLLLVVHIILFATLGMICFKDTPEEPEFDHMLTAIMSLIVLLTTVCCCLPWTFFIWSLKCFANVLQANFPDVMMGGYNSNRATAIFFIAFLIIGHLFLMNLVLATVVDSYQQQFAAKNAKKKRNSTKSLDVAFGILDFERKGVVEARALELLYRELQKHRLSLFKVSDEVSDSMQLCERGRSAVLNVACRALAGPNSS